MGLPRSAVLVTAFLTAFLSAFLTGCTSESPPQVTTGSATDTASPSGTITPRDTSESASAPAASGQAAPTPVPAGEVAAGLDLPWSIAMLPDGTALVSERDTARIMRIGDGPAREEGTLPEALAGSGEGGLLGLALSPDYAQDSLLFAYYTGAEDNRVVRMTYADGRLGAPEPVLTGIPKSGNHNGGRIRFGPDGNLYVGTGDAQQPELAQDRGSPAGKILRITTDGEPAEGNPDPESPVYSLGHRNVQGLAWDSAGRLWASEFGPDVNDELNLITPGGNYGWPEVTGAPGAEGFIDARVVWPSTATSSPSGLTIIDDVAYIGALRGERLWQVSLCIGSCNGSAGEPKAWFEDTYGRLRDVVEGPNGALWVAVNGTTGGSVIRLEPR